MNQANRVARAGIVTLGVALQRNTLTDRSSPFESIRRGFSRDLMCIQENLQNSYDGGALATSQNTEGEYLE